MKIIILLSESQEVSTRTTSKANDEANADSCRTRRRGPLPLGGSWSNDLRSSSAVILVCCRWMAPPWACPCCRPAPTARRLAWCWPCGRASIQGLLCARWGCSGPRSPVCQAKPPGPRPRCGVGWSIAIASLSAQARKDGGMGADWSDAMSLGIG
jgi:hypothetical protein